PRLEYLLASSGCSQSCRWSLVSDAGITRRLTHDSHGLRGTMAPYPHKEIEVLMRWSTCILLLVGLAGPVGGQTAVGQSYRNVNGNFSVMMPADPHETVGDETSGQVSHTIQAFAGSAG